MAAPRPIRVGTDWRANIAACIVGVFLGMFGCTEYLEPQAPAEYRVVVSDLRAVYDFASDKVYLRWSRPQPLEEPLSFYTIYRWRKNENGLPYDTITRRVEAVDTFYVDVLGLLKDSVFYCIQAVRTEGADTVRGRLSSPVAVVAGIGVRFTIDNGSTSTCRDTVTLQVVDYNNLVSSVRFTQKVDRFFARGLDTVHNLTTTTVRRFTRQDIDAMVARGFYDASTKTLTANVSSGQIPLFDAPDHKNQTGPFTLTATPGDTNNFRWVLDPGKEEKRVYMEVTLKTGQIDTLSYGMPIAPYRVRPRFENRKLVFYPAADPMAVIREGPSDASVIYTHTEGSQGLSAFDEYIFSGKVVRFTLRIDIDSTIAPDFEYWLVFPAQKNTFIQNNHTDTTLYWFETARRRGRLTGIGAQHDESFVYEYSLDTLDTAGIANLSYLRVIKNTIGYPYVDYIDTISDSTPGANYRKIMGMFNTQKVMSGKKEFFLAFRFTGRPFGEERFVLTRDDIFSEAYVLTSGLTRTVYTNTYFDVCPPKITMLDVSLSAYLNNGDTISGVFDYALDNASVEDNGKARITSVRLVIARCPPAFEWNYRTFKMDQPLPVTLDDIYKMEVMVLDYPLRLPWHVIRGVKWRSIDATSWPQGRYLMAIVTADEYGNEGLAPVNWNDKTFQTNPFMVYVVSGR